MIQGDSEGKVNFWDVIALAIVNKKFHTKVCLILNGH